MEFEKNLFEQKGLKIDQDRALTFSQLSCPLDCKYCFVEDMNYNQKRGVAYLTEEQEDLIKKLPEEVKIIMLGCDTEFFQSKRKALEILNNLAEVRKDFSVITKLFLNKNFIDKIKEIDKKLDRHNNLLALSVSLTNFNSIEKWEPKVPSPEKRIETLQNAFNGGIKTLVALRPLLPTVSDEELEKLIRLTKDYCFGYYSGPLYLKDPKELLSDFKEKNELTICKQQPHWMPEGNIFYKVEKVGQMEKLKEILQRYEKPLFDGAAEGIKYLRNL